ncbi:signal peptide peptidase SppA [uncultured Odoribacter sp.]|uniref:signal peptide peptidase SppA n=1 Tax=uncultured Odoribacter sp. TaxID=876416 RepID=UPI002636C166|nr:signal peptide peptidase SppA [uncultured Odoribacter sp.]
MKSFLKYTLATIVGVIIVNIVLLLIGFGIISTLSKLGEQAVDVKENSILRIQLNNEIPDRSSNDPFSNFNLLSLKPGLSLGLNDILKNIEKASQDSRIKGIYLDLGDIQSNFGGLATTEEIRQALKNFKKSGKFIYSYANMGYSQKSYYLATVADSIFVNPETPLMLMGMGGTSFFYKDMLDKIGIKVDIVKVGKYKSAVEPFTQTEMSDANREQIEVYLRSLWGTILEGISDTRSVSIDSLNFLANHLEFRSPAEEKAYGLFDEVLYEDQVLSLLKDRCGIKETGKLNFVKLSDYRKASSSPTKFVKDKIAIVYASGMIGFEQTEKSIGPELAETIRKAREDQTIKAIVLRVNSPGGSALTSDIIWREVSLATKEKPVIVSMGNVAASGGYYISCAADTIVADPTTLTGSIGIYGQFFSGEKLIKDKIGITSSVVKTNEHSDFGGGYPLPLPISNRPLTAYEKNVMQKYIEKGYETFLSRVAQGRHMSRDEVHEIAQGRVWTGKDALKVGLVDVLGGMEDALQIAARKAGLDNYRIVEYPTEKDFFQEFLNSFSTSIKTNILKNELGSYYETFRQLQNTLITPEGLTARIPYDININ